MKPAVARHAVCIQRGFIPQRNFAQNVIDLEPEARRAAMQRHDPVNKETSPHPALPAIMTWDFAAAFPSVAHSFMWLVLEEMLLPAGLVNLMKACIGQGPPRRMTTNSCS